MSPTGPSPPKFKPQQTIIPPRPHSRRTALEQEMIGRAAKQRRGYAASVLTRGVSLGEPSLERKKAERLGLTGV